MNNGANFCQVNSIKDLNQSIPWITIINHAWNGAAPSFSIIEINKNKFKIELILKFQKKEFCVVWIIQINRKIVEAEAWIIKYFSADSLGIILLLLINNGIKESILNSKPNHTPSQLDEEIEIKELKKIIVKNKIFKLLKINKFTNVVYYIMVF